MVIYVLIVVTVVGGSAAAVAMSDVLGDMLGEYAVFAVVGLFAGLPLWLARAAFHDERSVGVLGAYFSVGLGATLGGFVAGAIGHSFSSGGRSLGGRADERATWLGLPGAAVSAAVPIAFVCGAIGIGLYGAVWAIAGEDLRPALGPHFRNLSATYLAALVVGDLGGVIAGIRG